MQPLLQRLAPGLSAVLPLHRVHQLLDRAVPCPECGGRAAFSCGHYVFDPVVDEEDGCGWDLHSGFYRPVEGVVRLGTAKGGSVMQAVEAVFQRQVVPQISGALMLLDGGQMKLEACLPQLPQLCQETFIDVDLSPDWSVV